MKYYYIAKKYIEWIEYCNNDYKGTFSDYANITWEEYKKFNSFMYDKYNHNWHIKECKQYINEGKKKYIKNKYKEGT